MTTVPTVPPVAFGGAGAAIVDKQRVVVVRLRVRGGILLRPSHCIGAVDTRALLANLSQRLIAARDHRDEREGGHQHRNRGKIHARAVAKPLLEGGASAA